MILSAQTIRRLCRPGYALIKPFSERAVYEKLGMSYGLSSAGYDIRLGRDISVRPSGYTLGVSLEEFNLPYDLLMRVHDKSTWARKGLFVQNTVGEPGWVGFLTLEISNQTAEWMYVEAGAPIAQVVFEMLDAPTEQAYAGKYQNQENVPVAARVEEKK